MATNRLQQQGASMEDPLAPVFRILPTTQQYDWGKIGLTSKVAQLAVGSDIPDFSLDRSKPYAELWMGTHPSSPSRVAGSNKTLSEHLALHPQLVGNSIIERFSASDGSLPFLFKVLSIEKALSIQTHPDKRTAEYLHALQPHIYKDANHKPEMAIALTPFTALCGFLPRERISSYLDAVPEFAAVIPEHIRARFNATPLSDSPDSKMALKSLFSALMTADSQSYTVQLRAVVSRYRHGGVSLIEKDIAPLVLELYSQFPDDIGVFCAYVMNLVKLQPAEAIFLGAGEPHAYISGDIMECMANSDNVIRAGLTPKLRDMPNLLENLTYISGDPARHVVQPVPFGKFGGSPSTMLYKPAAPEFSVLRTTVSPGSVTTHRAIHGPSLILVLMGRGIMRWPKEGVLEVSYGYVVFVGEGVEVQFEALAGVRSNRGQPVPVGEDLVVFRAFVEVAE